MKQLFPRGKRIRPTDKDLVFHTALAALSPVFMLVVLLFHIRQISGLFVINEIRFYYFGKFFISKYAGMKPVTNIELFR